MSYRFLHVTYSQILVENREIYIPRLYIFNAAVSARRNFTKTFKYWEN